MPPIFLYGLKVDEQKSIMPKIFFGSIDMFYVCMNDQLEFATCAILLPWHENSNLRSNQIGTGLMNFIDQEK